MSIMCSIMLLISCDDNTKESQFTSCKNPGCRSACRVTNEWHSRIAYAMPLCWGVTRQISCNFNHQWLLNQCWLMMLLGGTYQPTSQTEHWDKFTSHKWSSVVISMGYYGFVSIHKWGDLLTSAAHVRRLLVWRLVLAGGALRFCHGEVRSMVGVGNFRTGPCIRGVSSIRVMGLLC